MRRSRRAMVCIQASRCAFIAVDSDTRLNSFPSARQRVERPRRAEEECQRRTACRPPSRSMRIARDRILHPLVWSHYIRNVAMSLDQPRSADAKPAFGKKRGNIRTSGAASRAKELCRVPVGFRPVQDRHRPVELAHDGADDGGRALSRRDPVRRLAAAGRRQGRPHRASACMARSPIPASATAPTAR